MCPADARDGLARQRITQLVDVVRAVDDLGATAAHEHVHQAFDAPELVHGLGRVGVAPGAQAKEHAALAQGADRHHGARGHRVLAREQRAVDIAEHGFDVAEGGVHGGLSRLCGGVGYIRERRTWYTKAQAVGTRSPQRRLAPLWWPDPKGVPARSANHHNIRRFSAKSRFSSNAVMVFTALRHDQNASGQTAATPREPPSRPCPPLRASAARQTSLPATGQSPAAPRRQTYCQSP